MKSTLEKLIKKYEENGEIEIANKLKKFNKEGSIKLSTSETDDKIFDLLKKLNYKWRISNHKGDAEFISA